MGNFLGKILLFNFKNKGNLSKWSGSGRMFLDGIYRNGNPLLLPCLENSMNRGAGQVTVHGIAESQTRLCD